MRTLGDILRDALSDDRAPIQLLPECTLGAQKVRATKKVPEHTKLTFTTDVTTPDDLLWFSGQLGQPESRKPKYVGILVWVPMADYEKE